MPELMDSHCHIDRVDLAPFDQNIEKMLQASRDLDVKTMLCVCIDLESFPRIHALALTHEDIYCSVGVHPTETGVREPSVEELIRLGSLEKVLAIGESGLDYYRLSEGQAFEEKQQQKDRFLTHIRAAKYLNKPLIVHTRLAKEDTIDCLQAEDSHHGVFHCFTEDWAMAKAGLDLGYFISFSGIVTFKNAQALQSVAEKVPLDRILIETDSPYLSPMPYRGKQNYPGNVHYVAQFLAELRGESYEKIAEYSTRNAKELFGLS